MRTFQDESMRDMHENIYIDFHAHHPSLHGERVMQDGDERFVGECGLDKTRDTPWEEQVETFRQCIRQSEREGKPLVLHCVRAVDDVLRLRREERAVQPWLFHGYRKGAEQLRQLLRHGFWFSFGLYYNEAALQACPADRLLLETDATEADIHQLYQRAADLRDMPLEDLVEQMQRNFARLTGSPV